MVTFESLSDRADKYRELERLEIEVTRRCPLRCIHCSTRGGPETFSKDLSCRDVKKIIAEFSALGGRTLTITGGEPLIRGMSFILEILKFAKRHLLSTRVYTSGYLMNESMAEKLGDGGVDMVCVSIEGSEITHDMITGVKGSYRRAVDALNFLKDYEVETRIHFTPMKINHTEFQYVANLGETLGVKSIKIFDFSSQGRGFDNRRELELSSTEMNDFAVSVARVIGQGRVSIRFGGVIGELSGSCSIGRKIAVTCNGDALPCLGLRERTEFLGILGNVVTEPLLEVWKGVKRITPSNTCLCAVMKPI